jgi:hypothetical protein
LCDYDGKSRFSYVTNVETATADIELKMAKTNHEIQVASSIQFLGINVPLMALIDYKGFRIIALADLKMDQCRLVYDLISEHPTVQESATDMLMQVSSELNLKPHRVMLLDDRRVNVPTSVGVKMFMDDTRGFYYPSNLGDVLPLDVPAPSNEPAYQPYSGHRLRTEFLRNYPHPLCSDAFTDWNGHERKEKDHNDHEVLRASRYLYEHWIPSFVKKLDLIEIRIVHSADIVREFHHVGINMRYLGK